MYTLHPKIARDEVVSYYGERENISIRINREDLLTEGPFDWDPLHYHKQSTQFFIVTEGEMLIEVEGEEVILNQEKVLEIKPNTKYRGKAVLKAPCTCLTIGTYNVQGDRVVVE